MSREPVLGEIKPLWDVIPLWFRVCLPVTVGCGLLAYFM